MALCTILVICWFQRRSQVIVMSRFLKVLSCADMLEALQMNRYELT